VAAFNTLVIDLICPRCAYRGQMEVEFRFGFRDQLRYRLGDRIVWEGGGGRKPLRRPSGGDLDGEGYVECPNCRLDFWVTVQIRDDVITNAVVDPARPGYLGPAPSTT